MLDSMLCAIPARGGSQRLPLKNTLLLGGKPMLAYSIEAALATGLFGEVFVCTEDPAIAEIARHYGAQVPLLMPAELCGALVPSHVPCQHLARHLEQQGRPFEHLLCLQPTSPLRSAADITAGVNHYLDAHYSFLVSVTAVDPHYFHWAVSQQAQGEWALHFGTQFLRERPLLPPVFRPNGSIKIAHLQHLAATGHFFGANLGTVETPEERSVHVGTRFDFDLCEYLLTRRGHE